MKHQSTVIEVWENLCDKDEELKSCLADALHYLDEAIGCVEEAVNGLEYQEVINDYPRN
ncbi:hypothetical protein [Dendronalium sp. ChiSLP03b]|uniref:hypothetical protein n=1 Tax=Dendronalium sp. ChiSLP03b TaxID=3075381 RepID=UPI00391A697A